MSINYCPKCGTQIFGKVRFCSKCGGDLTIFNEQKKQGQNFNSAFKGFIEEFLESNEDLIKDIVSNTKKGDDLKKGMFFAVEMKGDKPIIKSGEIKEFKEIFNKLSKSTGTKIEKSNEIEFKNASYRIVEENFEKKIIIEVPGVKNLENVSVNHADNSLEIEGKSEKVIYFATIPIKGLHEITDHELIDGSLIVRIR